MTDVERRTLITRHLRKFHGAACDICPDCGSRKYVRVQVEDQVVWLCWDCDGTSIPDEVDQGQVDHG